MRKRAFASVLVIAAMFIVTLLLLGLAGLASNSLGRADKENRALVSFQGAQAALDYAISLAYQSAMLNDGAFQSHEYELTDELQDIAPDCVASATVSPASDASYAWITSEVSYRGKTTSVRAYVSTKNVSIWNNAVFAGTGASGRTINGNVDIRGSMHCLGDGEPYSDLNGNGKWDAAELFTDSNKNGVWDPGEAFSDTNGDGVWNSAEPYNDTNFNGMYDPPLTTTDLNSSFGGKAYVGNNYYGMPAELRSLIPPPPAPAGIEQLGTEVRVKHGMIGLSGTATIGTSDILGGGAYKSTVDGTFVNDGWTGNQGASSVFSDNGTNHQYDLGHLNLAFPLISGIGAPEYVDSGGTHWTNQRLFLDNRALTIPINTITANTPAFSYGPDAYGNRISFTPQVKVGGTIVTPATLNISGVVRVVGNLTLGSSKEMIRYIGSGTMFATNDIDIHASLLPKTGFTFPTTTRLGLIAQRNMYLATGGGDAQLAMAGAFYAQGTIVSAKQNQILGTFVANFYDMGTNVPNIYQVPALVNNMPPAMPGDKDYFTLRVRTWRERKVVGTE
ncbi:MAG: hypothetical protein AKCLJLPJ_01856 [Fimbriimonadales bacterium]|nr:MAG: hypothetical protein EDM73_09300 [Armatimonadota bacterium]MBV6503762.1 hypothetical protein [Fimbriimonadales bacterium]MCE7899705.1 hypothetical protein [Armatimonadetes bacterium ATM1]MDL1927790.1 hypothetical protein [Fimbriimonadia bacterium ATM]MBC6970432.1 hypothetical protein [Armatimonadota bacterium]